MNITRGFDDKALAIRIGGVSDKLIELWFDPVAVPPPPQREFMVYVDAIELLELKLLIDEAVDRLFRRNQ